MLGFFFFSSRRRHTRCSRDWSSDVCSSDLILVPYPYATDDHQRRNAEVLVRAGAAEMILDAALDGERLGTALRALLEDAGRRATMAARARALGRPDAAERVATECLRLAAA